MRERSARSECSYGKLSPYGFIKYQVPMQQIRKWSHMRSGDLIILNSSHDVLVGMVIKLSGPLAHTNHECGPELFCPTLTVSFPSRRRKLRKISSRHPTLRPPFMGPPNTVLELQIYLSQVLHLLLLVDRWISIYV